jgi:hypothetical protein
VGTRQVRLSGPRARARAKRAPMPTRPGVDGRLPGVASFAPPPGSVTRASEEISRGLVPVPGGVPASISTSVESVAPYEFGSGAGVSRVSVRRSKRTSCAVSSDSWSERYTETYKPTSGKSLLDFIGRSQGSEHVMSTCVVVPDVTTARAPHMRSSATVNV